jgi:N-acyl-phosphatidylethanolamine-hydrolysing phospholipase D
MSLVPSSPPHHDPKGGFRNPWPGGGPRGGLLDLLRWAVERRRRPRRPDPDPRTLARATPAFDAPRAAADALTITWIGHATFLVQIGGVNVLTDPMWSERASPVSFAGPARWVEPAVAFDALPPIDLVLQSHNHYDHLDVPTVRRLAERFPEARWIAPLGVAALLERAGARARVTELDWWEETEACGLRIAATPARHFSARGPFDRNRTLWCGFAMRSAARAVFFAGDTALHDEFAAIARRYGPFDVSLVPIGAYDPRWFMRAVHMDPEEAVEAFRAMARESDAPGAMAAMHWGTFKLTDEPLDEPPRRAREAWRRAELDEARLWVMAFGETRRAS